ncbi:PIP5K5 [Symbiodinium microadriaticum]|nr:PIP5K5 [Symbiodinium microadriaticum]CAE7320713.1 PIP5K5 [Symbiodinium sp. KB8]
MGHPTVDAACAELRSMALERQQDWRRLSSMSLLDATGEMDLPQLAIREEWRSWRENTLLTEISKLPDGHRVLLQALLCDTLAGYEELQPRFAALTPPPRENDSLAARLVRLAATAQAETARLVNPKGGNSAKSGSDAYLSMLLHQKLTLARQEPPVPPTTMLHMWDRWYATAEKSFPDEALLKLQLLKLRQKSASKVICRAMTRQLQKRKLYQEETRIKAALKLQRTFRNIILPRLRQLRETVDKIRERCLQQRLHRRLERFVRARRLSRKTSRASWADSLPEPESSASALRIQAFCRGRWSRKGWSYCWDPPFTRASTLAARQKQALSALPLLTAAMKREFAKLRRRRRDQSNWERLRRSWLPVLQAEFSMLSSWHFEAEDKERRADFEARNLRRFEAQWQRYAAGLENFARAHALDRSKNRDQWVATVSDGKAVWLNERTGQTRPSDPLEARVRGTLARERKKAVDRFEDQARQRRAAWEEEDQALEELYAAGQVELQDIMRSSFAATFDCIQKRGLPYRLWPGSACMKSSHGCFSVWEQPLLHERQERGWVSSREPGLKSVQSSSLFFHLPDSSQVVDATKTPEGPHQRGPVELENGIIYTGQWLGVHRHGEGTLLRPDGGRYEGQFVNDRACGRGRFVHANGDVYEGQWMDDKAHGSGKFLHSDGSSYIGDWVEDMKSGQGLETWADGSTFKGEYRDGKKHGYGVFTSSDNSSYSGQFFNDSMHGEGTYTFSDGRVYVGSWQDSQMTGHGTMRWPDGRWYEGDYLGDRKSGEGKFCWPDGRRYVGQWLEGKQHGKGRYVDVKGVAREGLWKAGTRLRWTDEDEPPQPS